MDNDGMPSDVYKNVWCELKPTGDLPEARTGHTALYCRTDRKVIFIGGATPSALYNDVWILNLKNLKCSRFEALGTFEARYEHSAFFPIKIICSKAGNDVASTMETEKTCDCSRLWVFAGANTERNMNDFWELNFETQQWLPLSLNGEIPSPRTYHATSAFLDDKFVVFSGGSSYTEPVNDTQTYQLDTLTREWSILPTKGQPPQPRQGHVIVAAADKLYCHGGMSGKGFYDDLHILDGDGTWTAVDSKHRPSGRAAHGAVCYNRVIYIFGGLGKCGALNDIWRLPVDTLIWEEITTGGSVPSRRLNFSMVLVELPHKFEKTQEQRHGDNKVEEKNSETKGETTCKISADETEPNVPYILLHGGMDETGNMYDDFYVMSLRSGKDDVLG